MNTKLPNFLGIGAMRSGSSWLYVLLNSHPEVLLPKKVKEVHFFDRYYDRGLFWYQSFFPSNSAGAQFKTAGEITPKYLYHEAVPTRVREHLPDAKFIMVLRNPVERAYSHYRMAFFEGVTKSMSFPDFIQNDPTAFDRGLYAEQLMRWLDYFPMERFLILIFEEVMRDPAQAAASVAAFLDIDRQGFDENLLVKKVNPSNAYKLRKLYHFGIKLRDYLRKHDFYRARFFVVTTGSWFFRFLGESKSNAPPLDEPFRKQLLSAYTQDIGDLEKILRLDLSLWRI